MSDPCKRCDIFNHCKKPHTPCPDGTFSCFSPDDEDETKRAPHRGQSNFLINKFCHNDMCAQHVTILYGKSMRVEKDGQLTEYRRHLYKTIDGNDFYFCDICHNALRLFSGR